MAWQKQRLGKDLGAVQFEVKNEALISWVPFWRKEATKLARSRLETFLLVLNLIHPISTKSIVGFALINVMSTFMWLACYKYLIQTALLVLSRSHTARI
jgi:hypothetical protein